jgi:hypothetical protein
MERQSKKVRAHFQEIIKKRDAQLDKNKEDKHK